MANIVHFAKYYFPDVGGIETVTLSLAKGAVKEGHAVTVVCFGGNNTLSQDVFDGVKVIRAPSTMMVTSQPLSLRYLFYCLYAAKNADIVHLHFPNIFAAICALFIRKRIHLIVHWHSDIVNKRVLNVLVQPLEVALLRRAEIVIGTSQTYVDSSKMLANFKKKIRIIPIGILDPIYKKRGCDEIPQIIKQKVAGRKIIISVGRLVAYKGFEVLIEAAKHISSDSIVLIIGEGPLKNELLTTIKTHDVEDMVLLCGKLDEGTLQSLFMLANLFCLPSISRAEAFGVVLLEAMSYSLPIVTTNISGSGVPWVNQHGVSGLNVLVGKPIPLAEACNQILASPELRKNLSDGSRKRFLTEFSEKTSVNRVIDVYEEILSAE